MTPPPTEKDDGTRHGSGPCPDDTQKRLELALARAAAADRWRAHVESVALIHRQRALQVEQDIDHFRRQTNRLQFHVDQLNDELTRRDQQLTSSEQHIALQRQEIEELLRPLTLGEYCVQRLRESPLGPVLRRVKHAFRAPDQDQPASTDVSEHTEPESPDTTPAPDTGSVADPVERLQEVGSGQDAAQSVSAVDADSHTVQDESEAETNSLSAPSHSAAMFGDNTSLDRTKPILLFITAHSSDTTQGRHTLSVVQALTRYANVLVWHVGSPGPLTSQFEASATGFLADPESGQNYDMAGLRIARITEQVGPIDCAFVVGLECKSTLPGLAAHYLPTLLLIDNDAAYVRSVYTWQEVLFWSTHTLFTTAEARDQVLKICFYLNPANVSVLTPGSPYRPALTPPAHDQAIALLNHRLQGNGQRAPDAVVVGWGGADYASGLDLFVACADIVRQRAPDQHYRFVWFAQTGDTSGDTTYAFAVKTYLDRAELADRVTVIYEPVPVSVVLSMADLVLFPARTDILEHHMVDALQHGTPVVAFEQATVIAQSLVEQGFSADCLVRYGDLNALADRTVTLLQDGQRRAAIAQRQAAADWSAITLDSYAQALMARSKTAALQVGQERQDEAMIDSSGQLHPDYVGEIIQHHTESQDCSDARLYVKGWNVGLGARKPKPGFHPGIYATMRNGVSYPEDPFAAYLRSGAPEGPWCYPVILSPQASSHDLSLSLRAAGQSQDASPADSPYPVAEQPLATPTDVLASARVALHIHAYYPDMLGEFLDRIRLNSIRPDLFVSVRDADAQDAVRQTLSSYSGHVVAVDVVPNLGRDVGPFLTTFGQALIDGGYDLIGHVHTKRSTHADRLAVDKWRNFMLENVLGGELGGPMMDTVVAHMLTNKNWGIAFPDDPLPVAWDGNRDCAQILARRMQADILPDHFSFPAGNMFWIHPAALKPFVDLGLRYDDYPPEPLPIDGTVLHAVERLFGVMPRAMGLDCALISVSGLSR